MRMCAISSITKLAVVRNRQPPRPCSQYPRRDSNAGHRLRRPMLYPTELRGRTTHLYHTKPQDANHDREAICAASRIASTRLSSFATPCQAMSNAVPWSTDVRTMGNPRVTVTLRSKPWVLIGMWP